MRTKAEIALDVVMHCAARGPQALVAGVTASELVFAVFEHIANCPVCHANAWGNDDCELCVRMANLEHIE